MKPMNNKSMLHFLFDQMEKLDKNLIDVETAKAQANLAKQANNSMKYELDRASLLMKIGEHNKVNSDKVDLRNIESINFDSI
jgi:hypothetical protein